MQLNDFLYIKLNQLKENLSMEDYTIKCYFEQEFVSKEVGEKEIHVIIKRMTSTLTFNTITTPYQILVMSEEDSLDLATKLMDTFASENNWLVVDEGTSKIKLQFSQPMIMSNFEIVGVGYRSVLFVSATTYELENVADIDNGKISVDNNEVKYITASIGYGANMDTQQFPSGEIGKSIKTTAVLSITLVVPSQVTDFVKKCLQIQAGTYSGNDSFNFQFNIGGTDGVAFNKTLRLVSAQFATAVNDIPTFVLGFME